MISTLKAQEFQKQYGKETVSLWKHIEKTEGICTFDDPVRLSPISIKADMNRLHVIIIAILCFIAVPVAIAGDIVKHYDEHHNITGYTVIDGDRQTHYDSSWNRTGYTTSEETKDTHYDIEQNRIGHTEWDNDDTSSHYDKENMGSVSRLG